MATIAIRAHSRFAMHQPVCVSPECGDSLPGLLVELTSDSCRIGGLNPAGLDLQAQAAISIGTQQILAGTIRWKGDGTIGLRLDRPLNHAAMMDLLALQGGPLDQRRYSS